MTKDPGPKVTKNIHASMSRDLWEENRKKAEETARRWRKTGHYAFVEERPGARTPFGGFRRNTWRVRTRRPTAVKIGKTWRGVQAGPFSSKRDPKLKFHRTQIKRGHLALTQIRGKWWTVTSGRGARDIKSLPEHLRWNQKAVPAALRKVGMGRKKRAKKRRKR